MHATAYTPGGWVVNEPNWAAKPAYAFTVLQVTCSEIFFYKNEPEMWL
jgi:hypothetical protein